MRTETITKEIYSFEELTPEAQNTALETFRESNHYLDYDWWDFVYEYWEEKLAEDGFDVTENQNRMSYKWDSNLNRRVENGKKDFKEITINFSGFWSQGDGASFTAKSVDICKWILNNNHTYSRLVKLYNSGALDLSGRVVRDRNSHYVHENTTSFYLSYDFQQDYKSNLSNIEGLLEDLEREIQQHIKQLSIEIYRELEKEYEYLMSDECIKETIIANDYEFEQDGSRY